MRAHLAAMAPPPHNAPQPPKPTSGWHAKPPLAAALYAAHLTAIAWVPVRRRHTAASIPCVVGRRGRRPLRVAGTRLRKCVWRERG